MVTDALWSALSSFLPSPLQGGFSQVMQDIRSAEPLDAGVLFERALRNVVCAAFNPLPNSFTQNLWFGPAVGVNSGDVFLPGVHCPPPEPPERYDLTAPEEWASPDFIIAPERPRNSRSRQYRNNRHSWLVGDVKLSIHTLARDYVGVNNRSPEKSTI